MKADKHQQKPREMPQKGAVKGGKSQESPASREGEVSRARPVSLAPLSFERAIRGLAAVKSDSKIGEELGDDA